MAGGNVVDTRILVQFFIPVADDRPDGPVKFTAFRKRRQVGDIEREVLFMLLGGIGLPGGAVYINDHLLRSRGWRAAVSLAGPAMNAALILLLCVPFWTGFIDARFGPALAFLLQLQISAVLFNLLPIPPLDGFQAIAPFLPEDLTRKMGEHSNSLLWVLFIVMWYVPAANYAFWVTVLSALNALGIDPQLARDGWHEFQFWRR